MKLLQDLSYAELSKAVAEKGFESYRADQLNALKISNRDYSSATNLPKKLISAFESEYVAKASEIVERICGRDGAEKYLFAMTDGNVVEGVFMPHDYGNTLCISTQVGCRMGCKFCASGLNGLKRNLSSGEMLSEVAAVNALHGGNSIKRAVTNIVLMGSGEPLDNFDNVVKFLKEINDGKGLNISLRNVSLSTSGLSQKIKDLANTGLGVVLSVSLHAATDEKRSAIMPVNRSNPIVSVMEAADYYFKKSGRRVIFEYALGRHNSDAASAAELAALLKGKNAHVNLINLNFVKERGMRGLNRAEIERFMSELKKRGVSCTLRRSMGADIEGACGQLRIKYLREHDIAGASERRADTDKKDVSDA